MFHDSTSVSSKNYPGWSLERDPKKEVGDNLQGHLGHSTCFSISRKVTFYSSHFFSLSLSDFNLSRFEKLKNVLHIEDMELKHKRMITCFKVEMERWEVQNVWVKYSFTGSLNSSRGSRGCPRSPGWNPTKIFFVSNRPTIVVFFSMAGTFLMLLAGSFGCDRCWLTSESSSMLSKQR